MMRNLAPRISLIGWIFWLVLSVVLMIVLRFQTCCIADFPVGRPSFVRALADLEIRETAGLETCATEYVTELAPRSTKLAQPFARRPSRHSIRSRASGRERSTTVVFGREKRFPTALVNICRWRCFFLTSRGHERSMVLSA